MTIVSSSSSGGGGESGLIVRTPTVTSIRAVLEFSRKTGDLHVPNGYTADGVMSSWLWCRYRCCCWSWWWWWWWKA